MRMTNGIHADLSVDEYDIVKRARWSRVKTILDCPAAYLHNLRVESSQTRAKDLGSLVHAMVLEPEAVEFEYFRAEKCDRRTKVGKAAYAEQQKEAMGKYMIEAATYDQSLDLSVVLMKEMNRQLPGWRDGRAELSVLSSMYGTPAKCRIDLVHDGKIWDIKTTRNLKPRSFMSACERYGYYGQMASYRKMLMNYESVEIGGIIAIQTQGAPVAAVIPFSDEAKAYGRSQSEEAWKRLRACREAGHWPGYDYSGGLGVPDWLEEE